MLTQTDIDRERYEARQKALHDHNSLMGYVSEQRELGEMIGEMIGTIRTCERWLQRPQTPKEQLLALSLEDLTRLAEDLEKQAMNRR